MRIPTGNFARTPARRRLDSSTFDRSQFCALSLSFFFFSAAQLSSGLGKFLENRRDFDTYFISAHVVTTDYRDDRLGNLTRSVAAVHAARINYDGAVSESLTVIERTVKYVYDSAFCSRHNYVICYEV